MAKLTRLSLFVKVFLVALIASNPSRSVGQSASEEAEWQRALEANTAQAYHRYLSLFPAGEFVTDAIDALDRLGAIDNPVRGFNAGRARAAGQDSNDSDGRGGLY